MRADGSSTSALEKVELHCHLDGLLDPSMLRELAKRGQDWDVLPGALAALIPAKSTKDWTSYLDLVTPSLRPPERLNFCLELHIENLIRQNVSYAEIMVSGMLLPKEGEVKVIERFVALRRIADRVQGKDTQVELLVAIGRGPLERTEKQAEQILALGREGLIAGVAIAGIESACSIRSLGKVLAKFREAGLGLEIHAGEQAGPGSVWDALIHGNPDRIGHAVRAFEDERLVDELIRRDVHLEFCPSSNLCLGVIPNIQSHPIVSARQRGMNFSINTDDPGPFGCTIDSEFKMLEHGLGFQRSDFEEVFANAIRSRFGSH